MADVLRLCLGEPFDDVGPDQLVEAAEARGRECNRAPTFPTPATPAFMPID